MKSVVAVSLTLFAQIARGQTPAPDLSHTFLWGASPAGVVFEDTALAAPVKAAIRDDIRRVYQSNPQSNAVFRLYLPGDEEYGGRTGVFRLERPTACPDELRGLDYIAYGGTNYYFITEALSSAYASKIALTNRHHEAMGSLSNFLHSASHVSAAETAPDAFAQMWWRFKQGRAGELADDTAGGFAEGIQSMSEDRYCCLSLLSVWERPPSYWNAPAAGPPVMGCTVTALPKDGDGNPDGMKMDAVYKDGQWRFVAWE